MGSSSSVLDVVDAFKTLRNADVALDDHAFWKPFFTSIISPVELFTIVPPKMLRDLRRYRPCSLATLIFKCTEQLLVFASLGSKAGEPRSALNALALLARVLPFALEPLSAVPLPPVVSLGLQADNSGNVAVTLDASPSDDGSRSSSASTAAAATDGSAPPPPPPPQPLVLSLYSDNFAAHVFLHNHRCLPDGSSFPPLPGGDPLHVTLVRAVVALCFMPGFTIGPYQAPSSTLDGGIDPALLWAAPGLGAGPGAPDAYAGPDAVSPHRRAVLSALLVLLSLPMYSAEAVGPEPLFRDVLTLGAPKRAASTDANTAAAAAAAVERVPLPLAPTLFASLWNVVADYDPRGSLPYLSHFTSEHESVVCLAAQVLGAAMDYSPLLRVAGPSTTATAREEEALVEGTSGNRETDEERGASVAAAAGGSSLLTSIPWRVLLSCAASEAKAVLGGLCHLIENQTYARSTYLPRSQRRFPIFDEFVMLLWKLLDRCPPFLAAAIHPASAVPRSLQQPVLGLGMLVPLMDFALGVKERPQSLFQQLQITLFILQRVTAERDFCLLCNTPFAQYLPFEFPAFSGTYNDFIVIGMSLVMLLPSPFLAPFHESMAHIISNVSPFMTTTSSLTAERLLKLLRHWRNPDLLQGGGGPGGASVASNRNPFTLALLVEAMATLLQYQYPGSLPLALELSKHEAEITQLGEAYRTLELPLPDTLRGQLLIPTLQCAAVTMARAVAAQQAGDGGTDSEAFRRRTTLVGSLPIPHQIIARRVESGYSTDAWLTKVFWGAVFIHSIPGTVIDYRAIKLFATAAV